MITQLSSWVKTTVYTLTALLLSACGSESDIDQRPSEVDLGVKTSIEHVTLPAVAAFGQSAQALKTDITNMCASPVTDITLSNVQQQWQDTYRTWFSLLPFQFGPLVIQDQSSDLLDYIDVYRSTESIVRSETNTQFQTWIDAQSDIEADSLTNERPANVGLYALETALFTTLSNDLVSADIVAEFNSTPKKCDVVKALAYELSRRATEVVLQWTTDYRSTGVPYATLFSDNLLESYFSALDSDGTGKVSSEVLIVAVQEYLDFVGNAALFDDLTINSETLWLSIKDSIDMIESLLDQSASTELSLFAIMASNGYEQDVATIRENLVLIRSAIDERSVIDTQTYLKALDGNFKTSVIDGLNINKGLTFADGDS